MIGLTSHVLMVRPILFEKNKQTAVNNYYQMDSKLNSKAINELAIKEFDHLVDNLTNIGIKVTIHQDTRNPRTPDSIFPNNWISFHKNNSVIIYPMFAKNRRYERSKDVFKTLKKAGVKSNIIFDLTNFENENKFLEGTGSMILDRASKKLYASLSERTEKSLVLNFSNKMNYKPIIFSSFQTVSKQRLRIYHTNVMMSIGDKFAAICLESIDDRSERENVKNELIDSGKELILLSEKQVENFAGNMLLLKNSNGPLLVMSTSAYKSLTIKQKNKFNNHAEILHSDIRTIEMLGGGSVRCMLAEIF